MLDHIPTDNDIKLVPRKRIRFEISANLLLEHCVSLQLFRRNVDADGPHSRRKIKITCRPATRFEQIDTAPSFEEPIDRIRNFRTKDRSHIIYRAKLLSGRVASSSTNCGLRGSLVSPFKREPWA